MDTAHQIHAAYHPAAASEDVTVEVRMPPAAAAGAHHHAQQQKTATPPGAAAPPPAVRRCRLTSG